MEAKKSVLKAGARGVLSGFLFGLKMDGFSMVQLMAHTNPFEGHLEA